MYLKIINMNLLLNFLYAEINEIVALCGFHREQEKTAMHVDLVAINTIQEKPTLLIQISNRNTTQIVIILDLKIKISPLYM